MMSEEKARKVLDNLVRDIAVSTKRSEALSQLTNKELAEKLISDVWGISKLFGEKSDLLTEAIERLFVLDTPERVYCTADGEWPEHMQRVEFEHSIFSHNIGTFFRQFGKSEKVFYDQKSDTSYFHTDNYHIYWKPLTSLKDEYERQKDSE